MDKNEKIYIAGPEGMTKSSLGEALQSQGYSRVIALAKEELSLLDKGAVTDFFNAEKPDHIFLVSYKSGSIQDNINHPAEFIYENLLVQNNVIHNAYLNGVKKLLFFAASCIYPKDTPQPIKEEYLLTGELESTSQAYAVAKIAGIEMCRAYNKQYSTKFISIVPATIYGPGDHFDLGKSHVLSSLIRKFHEAKVNNEKELLLWGSGEPRREFIYADDLARACIFIMEKDLNPELINIGTGVDISIKELAEKIKAITGYEGEIRWDTSKPDGAKRKLLDNSLLNQAGWKPMTSLDQGLEKAYKWFISNYDKLQSS